PSSAVPGDAELSGSAVGQLLAPTSGFEATLPPTPLRTLFAADGASIFVFSDDAGLLDAVQRARGEHYRVVVVRSWSRLESALADAGGGVVLLDLDQLDEDLAAAVERLERRAKRLVTLAAADRAQAPRLVGLLSELRVHR